MRYKSVHFAGVFILTALGLASQLRAGSVLVDFENQPNKDVPLTSLSVSDSGVTFTITHNLVTFSLADLSSGSGTSSLGMRSLVPSDADGTTQPFVVTFSTPVNNFAVQMGDFGGDLDTLSLKAYKSSDGTGSPIASTAGSLVPTGDQFSSQILFVQGSGNEIKSVVIGGASVAYDNLAAATVPLPSAVWMFAGGALVAWIVSKRANRLLA